MIYVGIPLTKSLKHSSSLIGPVLIINQGGCLIQMINRDLSTNFIFKSKVIATQQGRMFYKLDKINVCLK